MELKNQELLFAVCHGTVTTTARPGSAKALCAASEGQVATLVFPPNVYCVDWGKVKLREVTVPFDRQPTAYLDLRWECERLD